MTSLFPTTSSGGPAMRTGLVRTFAVAALLVAAAGPAFAIDTERLKECEQDDVAQFSVRACTILLTGNELDTATRARIYALRARSWLTEDDPAAAAEDYTQVLKIEPGNTGALLGRVRALDLLKNYEAAAADWSALIVQAPATDSYYRGRGASLRGARKFDEALADFDKSLVLNPKNLDAYVGRALVYEAMDERQKALGEFDRALAVDPKFLAAYWERAGMADRWGMKDMAIADYIQVLKINAHFANARKHLERLGVYSPN